MHRLAQAIFCAFALLTLTFIQHVVAQGDYFLLVREWDPSVCRTGTCAHEPESRFTIHGLWPEFYNDTWPQYCTGEGFEPSLVADLEPVLRREWPSVFTNDSAFWKHEWRKHGTCAESLCPLLSDEHAFFFAVLALNKMYDLNTVVNSANITLDTPYTQAWLEKSFSDAFRTKLVLHCLHDGYHRHHHRHHHHKPENPLPILEVWMCFDKQMQPFDCPDNVKRECNASVVFPTHRPNSSDWDPSLHPDKAWNPADFVWPASQYHRERQSHRRVSPGSELVQGFRSKNRAGSVLELVEGYQTLRQLD